MSSPLLKEGDGLNIVKLAFGLRKEEFPAIDSN